jgi:hypothetical protein
MAENPEWDRSTRGPPLPHVETHGHTPWFLIYRIDEAAADAVVIVVAWSAKPRVGPELS